MSEALFDIVFKGKFERSIDQETAIGHFAKLFKVPESKAKQFFDGNPRKLKKSLTLEKASNFRAALKKASLRVTIQKQEDESGQTGLTLAAPGAILDHKPFVQPPVFGISSFMLDEVGIQLISFKPIEKLEFNLMSFQMAEVGTKVIEKPEIPEFYIDTSHITMEEVGALFDEEEIIEEPYFDITALYIDKVGTVIVEKEVIPEPDINIDNIKIVE